MKENIVKNKSFAFAISVVKLYQFLCKHQKEFVLGKQLLRSGTSAMVREAEHAETKKGFVHKMAIAQKEINETMYWIELLNATNYLSNQQFEGTNNDAVEIIKLIASIIKTTKNNINH